MEPEGFEPALSADELSKFTDVKKKVVIARAKDLVDQGGVQRLAAGTYAITSPYFFKKYFEGLQAKHLGE